MNMKKKETIKQQAPAKAIKVARTKTALTTPAVKEVKSAAKQTRTKAHKAKPESEETKLEVKPVVLRPGEVPLAIRKLLDTTNHIQARATELENALDALHEHERCRAVKDLLLALRNSPDGDWLRFNPTAVESGDANPVKAVLEALIEAFSIEPLNELGERILVRNGEIPDSVELDRSIAEETGECIAAEVVSVGWKIKEQILLRPVVRPLFK
jgi:hypothetical protein